KPVHIGVLGEQRPVKPIVLVIMAVGIVIAPLGAPDFVAHQDHRQPYGQQGGGQEVFHLPVPKFLHRRVIRGTLNAAVPASVVVGSVTIVFAVLFVVFVVIGDKIVQRKPIVTGHEVDALFGLALLMSIDFGAANQAIDKTRNRAVFAAKEAAGIVAEPPVPFFPTIPDKAANLIEPGRIPRF